MKRFASFVWKELLHILRDRRTLLILFGMPVAQILLFGFAIRSEITGARIAVVDQAHDRSSSELIERITASGHFELAQLLPSVEAADATFRANAVKLVLVLPPRLGERLARGEAAPVQVLTDATDPNLATTLTGYLQGIVMNYQNELLRAQGRSMPPPLSAEVRMLYNPRLLSVYQFVPGVMAVILMLVSTMMTSITIAREKELGTFEILLVSPLRPVPIIVGKTLPYLLLSLVNLAVILVLAVTVFEMPIRGSMLLLVACCMLYILAALALGILISTIVATQQAAMMISLMGMMLPTLMLSGYIFPIESMPAPLQVMSNVVPARWFIVILKNVMLKGLTLEQTWAPIAVLGGMTLIFLTLAVRRFNVRLA